MADSALAPRRQRPQAPTSSAGPSAELPWYLQPRQQVRNRALREICAQTDHPLRFLLEDRSRGGADADPKIKAFRKPPTRQHEDLIGRSGDDIHRTPKEQGVDRNPFYFEVGHLVTDAQLRAEAEAGLTPEPERFALQDAWLNQYDNIAGENAGVFLTRSALDIGGIPVEARTARMWVEDGQLPPHILDQAKPHPGWTPAELRSPSRA
ncbi:polymorphic toxin type 5 domain-containing protein [Aquabacterium sp. A7-Y]|uniref:polymorphic toxin type 5 domain-containing protein n=1 Tax=Aquabacterium sp. A7-Y TaxID=1349605 RepID=UPI00223CABC6|nr:polymorphic toxin type 5 domain-containing protein [Aquabacterium sp. A7-Y]MCW7541299.1 polymorphic toxin type 5 domain-containing protein [Aquabacterium sp. A7-Y]